MIIINLIEALQKQMMFCEKENSYKCVIYAATEANRNIIIRVLNNLLPVINKNARIVEYRSEAFVIYQNGNIIRIAQASPEKSQRYNGVIVDSKVNQKFIDRVILHCLVPLKLEDGTYDSNDNPIDREYNCPISENDVIESELYLKHNNF